MALVEKPAADKKRTTYGGGERDMDWSSPHLSERDLNALRRLGKKPVLKVSVGSRLLLHRTRITCNQRRFGFVSILGFCCNILLSWETILETLKFGLKNGGPAGLMYQYIFVWFGVMLSFVTICEMSSMSATTHS